MDIPIMTILRNRATATADSFHHGFIVDSKIVQQL